MNDPSLLQLLMATDPRKLARLPEAPLDKALTEVQALKDAAANAPAPIAPVAATGPAVSGAAPSPQDEGMAALATNIWRAKMRLIDAKTGEPREENRRLYRHIEGAMEAFASLGVRLTDWLDQPYDAGLPLKVISFQPTPEVTCDTVIEAVRPTVFWQDRLLQVGEVIVGIPETPSSQS